MEKKERREGESNRRRASISLKSPMPYPSPTVTLKLHCGQFWTFIIGERVTDHVNGNF